MEEISSLDSFQTDEANSSARPESENTQHSYKDVEENTAPGGGGGANDTGDGGDATKDSNAPDEEGGINEDDFEQISEGTFEVDENSRATSTGPPPDENAEGGGRGNNEGESRDFEEVDANVSGNNPVPAEESDMLGEADNTVPQSGDEDDNAMDVDQGHNQNEKEGLDDCEDDSNKLYERNDKEQQDESMEPLQQEADGDEDGKDDQPDQLDNSNQKKENKRSHENEKKDENSEKGKKNFSQTGDADDDGKSTVF